MPELIRFDFRQRAAERGPVSSAAKHSPKASGELDKSKDKQAKGKSSDGSFSVGAALAVNVAVSESSATLVNGRTVIAEGGSFSLLASNDTDATAKADGSHTSDQL